MDAISLYPDMRRKTLFSGITFYYHMDVYTICEPTCMEQLWNNAFIGHMCQGEDMGFPFMFYLAQNHKNGAGNFSDLLHLL